MRRLRLALLCLVALSALVVLLAWLLRPATRPPLGSADLAAGLTARQVAEDLAALVQALESVHVDPYAHLPRSELARQLDALAASVDRPLNRRELYVRLAPVVSQLNDGHTSVRLPVPEINDLVRRGGLWFPLALTLSGSTARTSAPFAGNAAIPARSELTSIEGIPIDQVLGRLETYVSSERPAHRRALLEAYFPLHLWSVYGFESPFEVTVRAPGEGGEQAHEIEGLTWSALQQATARDEAGGVDAAYSYSRDAESGAGIIDVRRFADRERFETFLDLTFASMRRDGVDTLIIDVRQNDGGSTNCSEQLVRRFAAEPFRNYSRYDVKASEEIRSHFKSQLPRLARWLPLQWASPAGRAVWRTPVGGVARVDGRLIEPVTASRRFAGDVHVLVGPRTFSTAATFAGVVQDHGLGTLIGEETGGLACSFGDAYSFELPHSRLEIGISCKYFVRPSGEITQGGIRPDHVVVETVDDRAAGRDPAMARARELIARSRGPASGTAAAP